MVNNSASEISQGATTSHNSENRNGLLQRMWKARTSYIMVGVFFVPFLIFSVFPILASAYISLTDYSGSPTQETNFLGIENFRELLAIEIILLCPGVFDEDTGEVLFSVWAQPGNRSRSRGRNCRWQ